MSCRTVGKRGPPDVRPLVAARPDTGDRGWPGAATYAAEGKRTAKAVPLPRCERDRWNRSAQDIGRHAGDLGRDRDLTVFGADEAQAHSDVLLARRAEQWPTRTPG